MKTMKRIVALMIVLVMAVSMLPLSAFANPNITFYTDSVTVAVGSRLRISCANATSPVSYSTDNEEVVYLYGTEARIRGEGTANITVTDDDGDTAVLEVVALPVDEVATAIASETTVTVDSRVDGNSAVAMFAFTAPEAGTYAIYSKNNSNDTYVYYYDSEMNFLGYDDDSAGNGSNFRFQVELAEGETIYVNTQFWANFVRETSYYDVVFEKLVPAEAITITDTKTDYYVGDHVSIGYNFAPDNAIVEDLNWTSDNDSVATVSPSGYVSFIGAGSVTITATTDSGLSDSITFTVSERPALESIEIYSIDTETPYVGDDEYLYVRGVPENAAVGNVTWTSDNEEVATVGSYSYGYVTFVGAGTVTITVANEDGFSDSVTFTVSERPALESIEIYSIDTETPYVGDYDYLYVRGVPENAAVGNVTWTSDNEEVATVESYSYGYVTFVGAGTVTITVANEDGFSDSVTFTVSERPALEGFEITSVADTTPYVGDSDNLYYDCIPGDALAGTVTWSSDNDSVATVDEDGYVEFVGAGTATITVANEDGVSGSVTFEVSERPALEGFEIYSVDDETPYVGDYDYLYYDCVPGDALAGTVTWSSDNDSVATVDEDGYVEFISVGTVTITVANEEGVSDSVTFEVSERPEVESIEIANGDSIDLYVGSYGRIYMDYYPQDAEPVLSYSSDNESVATVDEKGYIDVYSVGKATITVTAENGVSATMVVNGIAPIVPELDKEYYFDNTTFGVGVFEFVPEESGTYAFYSYNDDYDTCGYLYDGDMNYITDNDDYDDDYNFRIDYELVAGETYYFYCFPYNEDRGIEDRGYNVKLIKTVPPTGISFEKDVYNAYPGSEILLEVILTPDNAALTEYEFTSDNTDAVYLYSDGWCEISDDAEPCTVTVTVTTENGISATTVINIIEPAAITLNQPNEFTIGGIYPRYTFTPEVSGEYFVKNENSSAYYVTFHKNGSYYTEVYESEYIYFEAGVTYDVTVCTNDYYEGETFSFVIAESAYKNVELVNAPTAEYILANGLFVTDNEDGTFEINPRDLTGIKLKVTDFDGTVRYLTDKDFRLFGATLDGIDYQVDYITADKAGTYEATLYFAGEEFTYNITAVENTVAGVELVKGPKVSEYPEYFYPRYDGIQLLITYVDGTSETLTITEDIIKYEVMYSIVIGRVNLEGIEIAIISSASSPAMKTVYNPNAMLICNGVEIDLSAEITYDDEFYPVDVTVTQFDGDVDGMDIDVEFSDGTIASLELDVIDSMSYGYFSEFVAMTDMGIVYGAIVEEDGITYVYIFDEYIEVPESAMFVEGDVNNDGKLSASDYLMLKKIVFSQISLDDLKEPETALSRCDLNGDGKVTASDYLKLKRMIFTM